MDDSETKSAGPIEPKDRFTYLEAAFEDGDPSLIAHALGDVA